jgi:hypothetical protein
MNEEEPDKTTLKTENRNRNEENRRQINNDMKKFGRNPLGFRPILFLM